MTDPLASSPALRALLAGLAPSAAPLQVTPMPGGASTRRFFRLRLGPQRRAVAMYFPDRATPEEISQANHQGRRWPFLEVRDLLAERGIAVPALLAEDCDAGWLVVEDLGDDTLASYLECRPERRESLYRRAVLDLAAAQHALATLPSGSVVAERRFDERLLRWEIDHFREWGLEARGTVLDAADRALFDRVADALARAIASWPVGFVHRDYQSRNLMVRRGALPETDIAADIATKTPTDGASSPSDDSDDSDDETLVWIDFQDALLGPRVYDLVALLGDSYQRFERPFVVQRLAEYAAALGLEPAEHANVLTHFDLMTVQRKLKDAGRFVFIEHKKGDASFLPYVDPTLDKVQAALARLARDPALDDDPGLPSRTDLAALGELLQRVLGRAPHDEARDARE